MPQAKQQGAPPPLRLPEQTKELPPRPGSKKLIDKDLPVRYIESIHLSALAINMISVILLFLIEFDTLSIRMHSVYWKSFISLAIIAVIVVSLWHRLWLTTDPQSAKVYQENLYPRCLLAYAAGFHFNLWYATPAYEVDLQKQEIISAKIDDKTAIEFESMDGYDMLAALTALFNRRDGADALSNSLRFKTPELREWILAVLTARLSDLGGLNSRATLQYYKNEVSDWVANLFDGENNTSSFEQKTGTRISNPALKQLTLTPAAQAILERQAEVAAYKAGIDELESTGLTPERRADAVEVAQGLVDKEVREYHFQGVPPGVTCARSWRR